MGQRIVRMSGEIFQQILTEGFTLPTRGGRRFRVTRGLPEGAKFVGMAHGLYFDTGEWALKFEHPSWTDIPPDHVIPTLRIEFTEELMGADPDVPAFVVAGR